MRIATRGSRLARWQAETVATQLKALGHEPELVLVKTEGDRDQQSPIWELAGRGVFVKEVQAAVLDGRFPRTGGGGTDQQSLAELGAELDSMSDEELRELT